MDIDLARTFMEVVRRGSFIAAAEHLHITQTTVTARVQNLEGQLGCRLFVRNRSGARLTADGERFAGYASQLVQTWEAARRDLPLPTGAGDLLVIGGELSLWNPLLLNWISELRERQPTLALRGEVAEPRTLHEKLEHGVLDAALVHQPDYWPGMQVEQLIEEKLIMVEVPGHTDPYVYVDWGPVFRQQHDTAMPERSRTRVSLDLGPLALQYLVKHGGSGYFRTRVVQPYLENGTLQRTPNVPEFSYPIYAVYARTIQKDNMKIALESLREVASTQNAW